MVHAIEGLVVLQPPEEVGPQTHERMEALVVEPLRDELREAVPLALLGTHVKLLALVDIEKEGCRLGLFQFSVPALSGIEQVAQRGFAVPQEFDPPFCCFTRSGSVAANCQVSRNVSTSALSGSVPGLTVRKHQRRLSRNEGGQAPAAGARGGHS